MDRRRYLGFVVFPAAITALLAFLFFVARIDVFRARTLEQSIAELRGDADSAMRWKAALDLKLRGDVAALPALEAALADDDAAVRWHAAEAVAALSTGTAAPRITPLLEDRDKDVRRIAAFILGELRDARAREPLIAALGAAREDEVVRWNEAVALARLGDASGVPVLHQMLRAPAARSIGGAARTLVPGSGLPPPEPDRSVHANALLALALVGGQESVRPIQAFVDADIEPDLNELARAVLKRVQSRTAN